MVISIAPLSFDLQLGVEFTNKPQTVVMGFLAAWIHVSKAADNRAACYSRNSAIWLLGVMFALGHFPVRPLYQIVPVALAQTSTGSLCEMAAAFSPRIWEGLALVPF